MGLCGCSLSSSTITAIVLTLFDCVIFALLDSLTLIALRRPSWLHLHMTFSDRAPHDHVHQQNVTQPAMVSSGSALSTHDEPVSSQLRVWNSFVDAFPWIRYSSEISVVLICRLAVRAVWLLSAFLLIHGNRRLASSHFVPWQFMTLVKICLTLATVTCAIVICTTEPLVEHFGWLEGNDIHSPSWTTAGRRTGSMSRSHGQVSSPLMDSYYHISSSLPTPTSSPPSSSSWSPYSSMPNVENGRRNRVIDTQPMETRYTSGNDHPPLASYYRHDERGEVEELPGQRGDSILTTTTFAWSPTTVSTGVTGSDRRSTKVPLDRGRPTPSLASTTTTSLEVYRQAAQFVVLLLLIDGAPLSVITFMSLLFYVYLRMAQVNYRKRLNAQRHVSGEECGGGSHLDMRTLTTNEGMTFSRSGTVLSNTWQRPTPKTISAALHMDTPPPPRTAMNPSSTGTFGRHQRPIAETNGIITRAHADTDDIYDSHVDESGQPTGQDIDPSVILRSRENRRRSTIVSAISDDFSYPDHHLSGTIPASRQGHPYPQSDRQQSILPSTQTTANADPNLIFRSRTSPDNVHFRMPRARLPSTGTSAHSMSMSMSSGVPARFPPSMGQYNHLVNNSLLVHHNQNEAGDHHQHYPQAASGGGHGGQYRQTIGNPTMFRNTQQHVRDSIELVPMIVPTDYSTLPNSSGHRSSSQAYNEQDHQLHLPQQKHYPQSERPHKAQNQIHLTTVENSGVRNGGMEGHTNEGFIYSPGDEPKSG